MKCGESLRTVVIIAVAHCDVRSGREWARQGKRWEP